MKYVDWFSHSKPTLHSWNDLHFFGKIRAWAQPHIISKDWVSSGFRWLERTSLTNCKSMHFWPSSKNWDHRAKSWPQIWRGTGPGTWSPGTDAAGASQGQVGPRARLVSRQGRGQAEAPLGHRRGHLDGSGWHKRIRTLCGVRRGEGGGLEAPVTSKPRRLRSWVDEQAGIVVSLGCGGRGPGVEGPGWGVSIGNWN